MNIIGTGQPGRELGEKEIYDIVAQAAEAMDAGGKRVLVIVPDHTRTCPLPTVARALHKNLARAAEKLDFMIALGTHPALPEPAIDKLFGVETGQRAEVFPGSTFYNHEWKNPDMLTTIGRFQAEDIAAYLDEPNRLFARDIDVTINRRILDYDLLLIAGPVFPHEVVGYSGGAKYFFPGICGEELLNFFHWLGALITIPKMIGVKDTPVRRLLHAAMAMIPVEHRALCMVVKGHNLAGLYYGDVPVSWSAAVDLADQTHITYCEKPYQSILSQAPEMYDELWVGAKCMYKMECVVADGGELIIYAPHIHEIAEAHGEVIRAIGYHCLPYFTKQWQRFKDYPWGVLAHSTHVRGIGEFDGAIEKPRIQVTLATGIPEDVCRQINLGYRDPASIDPADWQGRDDRLHVPKAGEMLYRLKPDIAPEWQRCEPT
jgi:nickel-dependent lactate racemase